jgi:hypothetical protein
MSNNKYGGKGYEEKYLKNEVMDDEYAAGPKEQKPLPIQKPQSEGNATVNGTASNGNAVGNNTLNTWNPMTDPVVQQASALLQQHMASPVGEYKPVWLDEADSYLQKYRNRGPFSYDFNSDALYNQYKDQYIQQGQMAMMDTMGQAAALTGGYGNSYAQTVGQQAYNQYLGQLNAVIPDLYGMAYDQYLQEGNDLLNMYGLYMDRENLAYGQHQDKLNNWYKQLGNLTDSYNSAVNQYLGGDDDKEVTYAPLDYEQQQMWGKEFERAVSGGNINDVDDIADRMVEAGFDPQIVARWRDKYAKMITGNETSVVADKPTFGDPGVRDKLSWDMK